MPDYLPHTETEIASMLGFLGLSSLDELFAAVPAALQLGRGLELADGSPEPDVLARFEALGRANRARSDQLVCFAGGGAYDHEVPPVVRALAGRSEFVTSYTPYQAEVAQGCLQAVFEFQTMVARLAGLPVANASLYDGANALVEAVNLGVAAAGRQTVWMSAGIHPHWRAVLRTFSAGTGHVVRDVPLECGVTRWPEFGGDDGAGRHNGNGEVEGEGSFESEVPGVLVVGYPNYLGCLEDIGAARRLCDATGALLVVVADPVSAALLRSPGELGADVVVGEGQALGTALSFGGPYLGLFAVAQKHVRRLPGRLVGETVDVEGTRAYVTTLRAREQDIRREKATSNVCTNQTLMAIYAAVQLGWLGTSGLHEVALRCARGTRYCREALLGIDGVEPLTGQTPTLREFAIRTPVPGRLAIERLADEGYLGGLALADLVGDDGDGSLGADEAVHGLLVAVTERRTRAEVDGLVRTLDKVVR
jgi:glycine dehydrogenase subunit 1